MSNFGGYPPGVTGNEYAITLDDGGWSDFSSDYDPTDEQLEDWLEQDSQGAIKTISTYSNGIGILKAAWCEANENIIEAEWENQ